MGFRGPWRENALVLDHLVYILSLIDLPEYYNDENLAGTVIYIDESQRSPARG